MITLTSAQLSSWVALVVWPFARILALIASAPVTGNPQFPARAKVGLAILITVLVAPFLPAGVAVDPGSWEGLALLVRETLIGVAMGFAVRVVFTAVEMAGNVIGVQMGLGFAEIYNPTAGGQIAVIGQFLGLLAALAFLALDGHLMMISGLIESMRAIPPGAAATPAVDWRLLALWGGKIMEAAALLALPVIAALTITNLALGVLSRAAQQLNLFAVGFPITLAIGFITLLLALPQIGGVMERLFIEGLQMMQQVPVRR
jgi:flagellar biosynthetic protein FliR